MSIKSHKLCGYALFLECNKCISRPQRCTKTFFWMPYWSIPY